MTYTNINDAVRDIKRLLMGEIEGIDLQKIDDFIVDIIEKNRKMDRESRDPYVKEYLKHEYNILIDLLLNWRRFVVSLFLMENRNRIRFSAGGEVEKISNLIDTYLRISNKRDVLGIVKKGIPPFIGSDGKEYGPFALGDIILINKRDFDKLKEKGLIETMGLDI